MTDTLTDTLSSIHEIKFTKTEGCTPSTCICALMAIVFISIGASSGIYFGLLSYDGKMLKERMFKGQFTITSGEPYKPEFEKPNSDGFKEVAKIYKGKLEKLYNSSHYAKAFKKSEIIALERRKKKGTDDLIVHFNLHFASEIHPDIDSADLYVVLGEEVINRKQEIFKNITIDKDSIDITERRPSGLIYKSPGYSSAFYLSHTESPWEARTRFPGLLEGLTTEPTPPPRKCTKIGLPFCNILPYNRTSFPNIIGHWNLTSTESEYIGFRQLVDFECYPNAREFICRILQPECDDNEMIWPCRDFCEEFFKSCEKWTPKNIKDKIKCKEFPRFNGEVDDEDGENNENHEGSTEDVNLTFNHKKKTRKLCKPRYGNHKQFPINRI